MTEPNKRSIASHETKHDKISRLDGKGNMVHLSYIQILPYLTVILDLFFK